MLDLIKPKLVYLDLPLFMALLSDLFPGVEAPAADGGALRAAVEAELREAGLQVGVWLSECTGCAVIGARESGIWLDQTVGFTQAVPLIQSASGSLAHPP